MGPLPKVLNLIKQLRKEPQIEAPFLEVSIKILLIELLYLLSQKIYCMCVQFELISETYHIIITMSCIVRPAHMHA